jgi:hypothetical protein
MPVIHSKELRDYSKVAIKYITITRDTKSYLLTHYKNYRKKLLQGAVYATQMRSLVYHGILRHRHTTKEPGGYQLQTLSVESDLGLVVWPYCRVPRNPTSVSITEAAHIIFRFGSYLQYL